MKCRYRIDDIDTGAKQDRLGNKARRVSRSLVGWCSACRRREPDLLFSHGAWGCVPRYCPPVSDRFDPCLVARGSVPSGLNPRGIEYRPGVHRVWTR